MPAGVKIADDDVTDAECDLEALAFAVETVIAHRNARDQGGMSTRQAAAEAHVSLNTLYNLINRDGSVPSAHNLLPLLAWLGGDARRFMRTTTRPAAPAAAPAA